MNRKGSILRRSLASVMATAMAVTLLPAGTLLQQDGDRGLTAVADAEEMTNSPAFCRNVSDTASKNIQYLFQKDDGAASDSGVQSTKLVDAQGRTVDESKVVNEEYVDDGEALEYIENEANDLHADPEAGFNSTLSSSLPSNYKSPYLTKPVVNQGSWGLCWAFASTAVMEANIVKGIKEGKDFAGLNVTSDTVDLSERFLGWFSHNTYATDKTDMAYGDGKKLNTPTKAYKGGNETQVSYALAMGSGPEFEASAEYDGTTAMKGVSEKMRGFSVAKIADMNMINTYDYSTTNVNTVKAMVYNYGAATVTYGSYSSYYAADSKGKTNFYSGQRGSSHMVAIVGWDDSYSASNFGRRPSGDGAWLCRNSWGPSWGSGANSDGYFWMSYYQPTYNISTFSMRSTDSYGKAYYYVRDSGSVMFQGSDKEYGARGVSAANIYQASGEESLTSVGVQTNQNGLKAEVSIYTKSGAMSSPTDGNLATTQTINDLGMIGYHTIDLGKAVALHKGDYFSVIIRLIGENTTWFICEQNTAGTEKKGQTFYYDLWSDAWIDGASKSMASVKNAAIYAYTKPQTVDVNGQQSVVSAASELRKADVESTAGTAVWNRIQAELSIAKKVSQAVNVTRSVYMLQSAMSTVSSQNLYADSTLSDGPGRNGVEIYANGGTVKVNGVSVNYKTRTLHCNFVRTYSWVKVPKKNYYNNKLRGKYVAAVTTTKTPPELNLNGTVKNPDADAMAIASASISGSKVTIKPKASGDVYVWVLWYPKSDLLQQERIEAQMQLGYAMTKVHVDTAPANVRLYAGADADPVNSAIGYTSATIPAGGSTDVYVKGTVGKITKTANTMKVIENSYIGYNCTVPAKYADYISVIRDTANPYKFHIAVDSGILGIIKDGKKLTVTLPFVCDKNGKKANFKVIVGNPVKTMSLAAGDDTTQLSVNNTTKTVSVVMGSAKTAAQTAMLNETTTLYNADRKGTDSASIVRIPCENGFTYSAASGISVVGKVSAAQKKVSIAAVKKQPGYYKITAAKGTQGGTEAYFVIAHNTYDRKAGAGYQVVHVKVGEANHVTRMSVAGADATTSVTTDSNGIAQIQMDDSSSAKKTAQFAETITLSDSNKEGTDITGIYRLPAADAFTVTTAKEITVTEALSAEQKKVTMAKVSGKANEYRITAAKGVRPGTEAYFMLFHNSENTRSGTGYQIIKVVVGVANHVTGIRMAGTDGSNVSTDSSKIATIRIENSAKAKKTAKLVETITLASSSNAGTDPVKVYRMPTADSFRVTAAKEIAVTGTLTAAQKKVTMAKVKGTDSTYQITAAKGVKAGTEVYFMLFHNAVSGGSGTGYQIIRVIFE